MFSAKSRIETLNPLCKLPHYASFAGHVDYGVDAEHGAITVLLSVAGAVKPLRTFIFLLSTQGALDHLSF